MSTAPSESLVDELERLLSALEDAGLAYAVAGGFAVAIHAQPRATEDMDFTVLSTELPRMLDVLSRLGYQQLADPMRLGRGTLDIVRVLRLLPGQDPFMVDLLVPVDARLAELATARDRRQFRSRDIWVLSRAALIEFKRLRGSRQDLADIDALEAADEK